jgi:hypothetical protein
LPSEKSRPASPVPSSEPWRCSSFSGVKKEKLRRTGK